MKKSGKSLEGSGTMIDARFYFSLIGGVMIINLAMALLVHIAFWIGGKVKRHGRKTD